MKTGSFFILLILFNYLACYNFYKEIKHMEEKTKYQIEKEKAEKRAVEKENKILSIVLPVVGVIAFIVGLLGAILTLNQNKMPITVVYIVLAVLGFGGVLYGIVVLIRIKKPDFLKKKVVEQEDEVLPD